MLRFLKRHKLMVAGAILALIGLAVVRAATSRPSLDYMIAEVAERLEERLGLSLEIGHASVRAGSGRVEAAPVIIKDLDGVVLFSAERITLELAALPMFARRVQVDDLEVVKPRVHVRVTRDGRIKGLKELATPPPGGEREPLFRVDVEDFRVEDASVLVDIEELGRAEVKGVRTRLRSSGRDGHRLKFSVEEAAFERPGDRIETDKFQGRLVVFGDGLLAPERVTLHDIMLRSDEGTLHVAGSVLLGPLDKVPALDLDVHGTTSLPVLTSHVDMPVSLEGEVAVGAHISSALGAQDIQVVGQGDIAGLVADGFSVGTLRGQFVGDDKQVTFTDGTWQIAGTTLDGAGQLQLNEDFDFTYEVTGADLSIYDLLVGLQIPGSWVDVNVSGEVVGQGHLFPEFQVSGTGRGHFHDLVVGNKDARTLATDEDVVLRTPYDIAVEADWVADMSHLELHGFIDDDITRADGDVTLYWDPDEGFEIFATSRRAGFGSIDNSIAGLPFEGTGAFQIQIAGPYVNPLIVAQGQAEHLVIDGYELADVGQSHIRYLAGELGFYGVQAKKGATELAGDIVLDWWEPTERYVMRDEEGRRIDPAATVALEDGLQIALDLDVTEGQASDLRSMIPTRFDEGALAFFRDLELDGPVKGNIDAKGYIGDGTIDHLTGRAAFALGRGASLLGQRLDGGHTLVRLLPGSFAVDQLVLQAAGGDIETQARIFRDDGELAGPVEVKGLELAGLDALKAADQRWKGTVDASLQLSGLSENPTLVGFATLRDAAYGEVPIGDADLTVLHKDRRVALKGPVMSGRARSVIDVSTEAPFEYDAHLDVKEGPLAPLLPPRSLPEGVDVRLAGPVEVQGALSHFADSRGAVVLESLEVSTDHGLTFTAPTEVIAHFHGDEVTLDQLELSTPRRDHIEVGGLFSTRALDLTLSGEGDLWLVARLTDQLRSSAGRFQFDVALAGDYDAARMSGRAAVTGARFDVEGFDPVLSGVDGRLVFAGPNVLIENVRGTVGGAPFEGEGTVTLDGLSPEAYDLEVEYSDLELKIPEWLPSRSSGQVTLTGPAAFPTLAGEVQLHQASYTEDINWERFLPEFRRKVRAPLVFDKEEEDLRFDLHLVSDGGIVVKNNVADIEAKGDLYLVGTEERPGMRGTLSLLHGVVDFRQNRYRLTRGTVEFTETYAITPLLDIEAETTVKDYDITAHVTGPVKNLRIDLSSRPDLAEIDVLSLLTFGFTQVELQDTAGTAVSSGLEVVSAYTGLEQEVKRFLPEAVRESGVLKVDELRLTSQFSSRQQGSVPAVSVGFEVNPGFWGIDGSKLRLSSTLVDSGGAGTDQRIEWEKRFDNNLRLRLVWNSQDQGACPQCNNQWGDLGGDVWYRWEF